MLVPKLRFKREDGTEYPEWDKKTIGKYARIYDGVHQTPNYIESGVPFVSVEDIESLDTPTKFISAEDYERDFKTKPKIGDILMTRIGDVGRTAIVPCDGYAYYVSLALIKPFASVSNKFLCQAMKGDFFQRELWEHTIHTAFPKKINAGDIQHCEISIPSDLEEQQKIADFLSAVDEVIAQSQAEVQNLAQQKKAAMQKIFSQEVRFKKDDGTEYPQWEEKCIKDIAPLQRGFDLPEKERVSGEYPVVCSNGIVAYHNQYKCEGYAVITGRSGTIGNFTYLDNCKYWAHNTSLWVTDFCGNYPKFVYYFYQTIKIEQYATGTGVPTLNRNNVHSSRHYIPCFEEQQKISDFLSAYDEAISCAKQELEHWKQLKKGLLQQMFV